MSSSPDSWPSESSSSDSSSSDSSSLDSLLVNPEKSNKLRSKKIQDNEGLLGKILLSEKFSDVHFHCPDGTILHAHKVILSTQCTYFSTVFEGPWDKKHPNGVWVTNNSSTSMKVILTFLYKGEFVINETHEELLAILSLSHEYELRALIHEVAKELIPLIDLKNVKDITHSAYTYNLEELKISCCEFINENVHKVLMDVNFIKLANENSSMWTKLQSDLESASSTPHKKSRKTVLGIPTFDL